MKFTACSTPSGLLATTLALLVAVAQANDDANAGNAPRMQRLTRRNAAVEPAPLARRTTLNATTDNVHHSHSHVVRQDKVASTISNSTSSASTSGKSNTETVGELVNKHLGSSPYNVAQALQLLSDGTSVKKEVSDEKETTSSSSVESPALVGVKAKSDSSNNNSTSVAHLKLGTAIGIVNPNSKLKQIVKADHVRRGNDDDNNDEEQDEDCEADDDEGDEECEGDDDEDNNDEECEEDDDEDSEECEEDGDSEDEDDEECEEDGDDDDEECDEEGDGGDDDEADAPTRQALDAAKNFASTNGGEASGSTPSNLAEGSLSADKGCTKFAVAESGDSCYKLIGTKDDATLQAFYKSNPNVDSECQNLAIGASYCVASSA